MRTLNGTEIGLVSGGGWSLGFDAGVIEGEVTGDSSVGELAQGAIDTLADSYWVARDATADFYEMIGGWFSSGGCSDSGGGGR